jgi:hypothetical protein
MNEEIFGPILPIITVRDIQESIGIINTKPKPPSSSPISPLTTAKKRPNELREPHQSSFFFFFFLLHFWFWWR